MNTKKEIYTYKQLVGAITDMGEGYDETNRVGSLINKSFEAEKITWQDHQRLYQLMVRVAL